jgi:hypothetical protein
MTLVYLTGQADQSGYKYCQEYSENDIPAPAGLFQLGCQVGK